MTPAGIRALYATIVAAEGPCPGSVDPISQECSVVGCKKGQVPLLPGLREPCDAMGHVYLTTETLPCLGWRAKPLSLETLLESLTWAAGWDPLVNVGRTFARDRWEAVVDGFQELGGTPTEALLRALARAIGGGWHD